MSSLPGKLMKFLEHYGCMVVCRVYRSTCMRNIVIELWDCYKQCQLDTRRINAIHEYLHTMISDEAWNNDRHEFWRSMAVMKVVLTLQQSLQRLAPIGYDFVYEHGDDFNTFMFKKLEA